MCCKVKKEEDREDQRTDLKAEETKQLIYSPHGRARESDRAVIRRSERVGEESQHSVHLESNKGRKLTS